MRGKEKRNNTPYNPPNKEKMCESMNKIKSKYLRRVIIARRWANTEKGERIICAIGAVWGILAFISAGLLVTGVVLNELGVTL